MKQVLLSLCLFVVALGDTNAQCTPNPLFQDSLFGVWPDTINNLLSGEMGVFYSDTMNIIIPVDAGNIDPLFAGTVIDSMQLDVITGLPPGLNIDCNSQTGGPCTLLPRQLGCLLIEGIPTQNGSFPITVDVTGFTTVVIPISVPFSFTGYRIDVGTLGVEERFAGTTLREVKNVPNPFSRVTDIEFVLNRANEVTLQVFDLLGQGVFETVQRLNKGKNKITFKGDGYEQGIYIYQLSANGVVHTGRMILDR